MKMQNWIFRSKSGKARSYCKFDCSEHVLKTENDLEEANILD